MEELTSWIDTYRLEAGAGSGFPSVAARDAALAAGMEYGATESFERLNEVLAAPAA